MRHVVETGSDVAAVCVFDPGAIPENLVSAVRKNRKTEIKQLADEGKVWWHNAGGDGTYLFHIFVDEQPPPGFAKYSSEINSSGKLAAPSGVLCLCGAEEVDDSFRNAGKRNGIDIPAGNYTLQAWALDWPEELLAEQCESRVGNGKQAKGNRGGLLVALYLAVTMLTAFGSIVATISWLARSKASSGTVLWFWGATILLVAVIPRLFPKPSPDDMKRFEAQRAILSEFPDFVLSLRKAATLIALTFLCAQSSVAQQVVQIRWPSKHASSPVSIAGVQGEWLPAFRLAIAAMPEETIVATSLSQGQWLGLRPDEAKKLQGLFSNYYSGLRQSDLFGAAPSALQYCFSDRKPAEGLATAYIPNKVSNDTKTIVFLHGYGGSLLAYLHLLSGAFSNHVIICPAYGISCANVPASYITEASKAVSTRLKVETGKPMLIGLSAGGFGACRLFVQKPEMFRGLICLAAYPPSDTAHRFGSDMDVRFVCGALEPYVANGSLRQQMQALKPRVKSLDWKILDGADHYFLLSHEDSTRRTLLEWESP